MSARKKAARTRSTPRESPVRPEAVDAVVTAANIIESSSQFVLEEAVSMYQALRAIQGLGTADADEIASLLNKGSRCLGNLVTEIGEIQRHAESLQEVAK